MILRLLLKSVLLPPAINLLLLLVAYLCRRHWPRLSAVLAILSLSSLYLLATPLMSVALMQSLERHHPPLAVESTLAPDAIVILGGGRIADSPEYASDNVATSTLQRLHYGAYLHQLSGAPILVSGGTVYGEIESEAALMARVLERDFQVPVRWREERSRNTRENAQYSAELLQDAGYDTIWLVTQAWHMPRSVDAYNAAGFTVIAAPTGFSRPPAAGSVWAGLIPQARYLADSSQALHEWLGLGYYRLLDATGVSAL